MLNACISLFFPDQCKACDRVLQAFEKCICTHCRYHLPQTDYHLDNDNPLAQIFWGKAPVAAAAAYYFFHKGGAVQNLLHNFKYRGHKDIGLVIGEQYGHCLMQSESFRHFDLLIPVPLHPEKEKKRGYNQSLLFAQGLSKSMGIQVGQNTLIRNCTSETQTKKSRFARWKNVQTVFNLHPTADLNNKHILLVDDVLTTGATLEACIQVLLPAKGLKISIAAMAWAW